MKYLYFFITFLSLLTCSITFAQNQPITFNPNMLAHSQGLPNDFLLFSADTTVQILFNNARAGSYNQRFVYVNYLPQSPVTVLQANALLSNTDYISSIPISITPTFSAASLFDALGKIWILEVSNWSYRNTSESNTGMQDILQNPEYPNNAYYNSTNTVTSNLTYGYQTTVKLSLICNSASIGIFGIVIPESKYSTEVGWTGTWYPISGSSYLSSSGFQSQVTNTKNIIGIEYSQVGSQWDLITDFTVQKNILNESFRFVTNDVTTKFSSQAVEPFGYGFRGYFQHSAQLVTPDDHYFVSTGAYYLSADLSVIQNKTSNPSYLDTAIVSLSDAEKAKNWGTSFSCGYIISKKLIDLDVRVGFNPQFNYDNFKDAYPFLNQYTSPYSNLQIPSIFRHQLWTIAFQIPIYLNFTPVGWCSMFGGLNYKYLYQHEKVASFQPDQQNEFDQISSVGRESESQTLSNLSSTSNVYAGMELRHASGLRMQIAFRGNLSNYSSWGMSLGYIF